MQRQQRRCRILPISPFRRQRLARQVHRTILTRMLSSCLARRVHHTVLWRMLPTNFFMRRRLSPYTRRAFLCRFFLAATLGIDILSSTG